MSGADVRKKGMVQIMEKILVRGGVPLMGSVEVSGFKNAALPIIYACVLVKGRVVLENIPNISDITCSFEILQGMGAKIRMLDRTTYSDEKVREVLNLENIIDPIIILDRQDVLLNASVAEVSEKLYFDYTSERNPEALYCEMIPGGNIQVCLNQTGEDSKVNLEALFNTVHQHKELIKGIFNK